jgi:hypothetical protein
MQNIIQDLQWFVGDDNNVTKIKKVYSELDQWYFGQYNDKTIIGIPDNRILKYYGLNFNQSFVNLTHLNCYYNQLMTIPPTLVNLIYLDCGFNQLTNIPSTLVNLTHLY